jgi:hypothetical protein
MKRVVAVRQAVAAALVAALSTGMAANAAEEVPGVEALWAIVQQQQAELEALRQELQATRSQVDSAEAVAAENTAIIESVAEFVESSDTAGSSWASRTTVGGYGEMLYNHGTSSGDSNELDIQRFVLFLEHAFNDRVRFVSETEIEHSYIADDARSPGAVELEQAYIQWDYARNHSVLAGMYLAPLGILNETHEPNTFFGVERNQVESRIIPTTYRMNGVMLSGRLGPGWSYDFGIHEGLFFESSHGGEIQIRESRQNGARAELDSPGYTGRIRYTGVPGLELGLALHYQTDMTQEGSTRSNIGRDGLIDVLGNPVDELSGLLSEAHLVYQRGGFGFRALYASWDIDDSIISVANNDLSNNGIGRDEQYGFYLEPSYRWNNGWGVFVRYEEFDERAGSNLGAARNSTSKRTLLGLNYWLTNNTVMKLDYQFENDDIDRGLDGFNLGIGWQF